MIDGNRLRELAEQWENDATEFYYAHRHGNRGIGYAAGFEEGLSEAARRLITVAEEES